MLSQVDEVLDEVVAGPLREIAALARKRVRSRSIVMRSEKAGELKVRGEREKVEILGQVGTLSENQLVGNSGTRRDVGREGRLKRRVQRGFSCGLTQDAPPWEKPSLS